MGCRAQRGDPDVSWAGQSPGRLRASMEGFLEMHPPHNFTAICSCVSACLISFVLVYSSILVPVLEW